MTELSDYSKFAEGPLVFPIGGKKYVLPELGIPEGLELSGIIDGSNKAAQKMKGAELWRLLLGPLWDEMIADGVPLAAATRAGLTVLADRQYGRKIAEITWETGGDPKAIQPYLEATASGNRAQRRSHSTAGAKKTPSQASTTDMTSPSRTTLPTKVKTSSGKTS